MPWKERTIVQEKQSFIMEWMAEGISVAELCRTFGISRTLGYRYIRRYLKDGMKGLEELSRAPRQVWNKTSACVKQLIVDIRKVKPRYGALTIHLQAPSREADP